MIGDKETEMRRARSYSKRHSCTCKVWFVWKGRGKGRYICMIPKTKGKLTTPGAFNGLASNSKAKVFATFTNGKDENEP